MVCHEDNPTFSQGMSAFLNHLPVPRRWLSVSLRPHFPAIAGNAFRSLVGKGHTSHFHPVSLAGDYRNITKVLDFVLIAPIKLLGWIAVGTIFPPQEGNGSKGLITPFWLP